MQLFLIKIMTIKIIKEKEKIIPSQIHLLDQLNISDKTSLHVLNRNFPCILGICVELI